METSKRGKAITGIALVTIMVASVMVAMIGGAGADTPVGRRYNDIQKGQVNTVLIGQDLQFKAADGWTTPVVINRYESGDLENTYTATLGTDGSYYVYNVNWPTFGAFYVNGDSTSKEAQLSVEEPKMPLKLKVKEKEVSSIARSTPLNIDVGGINLDDADVVDLVIIGPNGQIAEKNGQTFKGITVDYLKDLNEYDGNAINTTGWDVGRYTFQVTTVEDKACNLEDQSVKKELTMLKVTVQIKADVTEVPELTVVQLIVTGIAGHKINIREDTLSKNAYFPAGLDDNPMTITTNNFTDTIDDDGTRTYAVEFNDTGAYTIRVTDLDADTYDTVDITILRTIVNAGRRYNEIAKDTSIAQIVLIGQDLLFKQHEWGMNAPVISRFISGNLENTYKATTDTTTGDHYIYNVNWPTSGAFYVNYVKVGATVTFDAQLSVEEPKMPLKLKVKEKEVSSIARSTYLNIDVGGINLDDADVVDLVIIGPDGQILEKNSQTFKGITVAALKNFNNGGAINTTGWDVGRYTFQVKTVEDKACNLEDQSVKKELTMLKVTVQIKADATEVPELTVVQLIVTGIAGHKINIREDTLSKNAYFPAGLDDNSMTITTNNFTDTIDDDGTRTYAVEFNDTGVYTIKVTDYDETDSCDTVDITVTDKDVMFDVPSTVVIGDRFHIKGTSNTGQTVTIAVEDEVVQKLYQIVIDENGEFDEEIDTSSADAPSSFMIPGSVRLKAYIDYEKPDGQSLPFEISSSVKDDGSTAVLMSRGYLEAELSTPAVAQGDDFTITGTAEGAKSVSILIVAPKGYSGSNIEGGKYMYYAITSVTANDNTFYKKISVGENVDTGRYLIMLLTAGSDGKWGMFGYDELYNPEDPEDSNTALGQYTLTTRTQEEMLEIVEDMIFLSDDQLWIAMENVQTPFVILRLNPIAGVGIGEPLDISGVTKREEGHTILITVKGPVELTPATVKPENGTFRATIDTTDAKAGSYIVKADDGKGNIDEKLVDIGGVAKAIFDTGTGTYPSIAGSHKGTITPNVTIQVSKLYTYPCAGTGGHTENVIIWNESGVKIAEADWKGYQVDSHTIIFDVPFALVANETYDYSIRTGSYPQIIHADSKTVAGGTITCDTFVDTNGNEYEDWIPAIRLGN